MTTTTTPKYAVGDLVQVRGTGSRHKLWTVKGILPPTPAQPQFGYLLVQHHLLKRQPRTVDEDRLIAAGEDQ